MFFTVLDVCRCRHLVNLQDSEGVVVVMLLDVVAVVVVITGEDMATLEGVEGGECITIIRRFSWLCLNAYRQMRATKSREDQR